MVRTVHAAVHLQVPLFTVIQFFLNKLLICCLLILSKVFIKFRRGVGSRDLKYDNAEQGFNMCFISINKQPTYAC